MVDASTSQGEDLGTESLCTTERKLSSGLEKADKPI